MLIDLVALEEHATVGTAETFRRAPGGAPANVAVALARLGVDVAFIGKLGADPFGRSLRETLVAERVDVRSFCDDGTGPTALAVLCGAGRAQAGRSLGFYRSGHAEKM